MVGPLLSGRRQVVPLMLLAGVSLSACNSSPAAGPPQKIGPQGGTVRSAGVVVEIPPGALPQSVPITVSVGGTAPSGYHVDGQVFDFAPAGLTFAVPISVTFPTGKPGESVFWTGAGAPDQFGPLATTLAGTGATALVTHFSSGFVGAASSPTDDASIDAGPSDGSVPDSTVHDAAGGTDSSVDATVHDTGSSAIDGSAGDTALQDGSAACTRQPLACQISLSLMPGLSHPGEMLYIDYWTCDPYGGQYLPPPSGNNAPVCVTTESLGIVGDAAAAAAIYEPGWCCCTSGPTGSCGCAISGSSCPNNSPNYCCSKSSTDGTETPCPPSSICP